MLTQPFLTDLDSRAAVKGSRDPLGVQAIWTRFGRHVVGNLTTVSTSLRDFTTLLLGYHFAERVADEGGGDGDLATFLKWEQLAAYARGAVNKDWLFRGTERVQRNLSERSQVRLSVESGAQILGNQKIYGLWGLYTVPARSSALVDGEPTRLTPAARKLIEDLYIPIFTKAGYRNADAVVARLRERHVTIDVVGRDRPLLEAVAKTLQRRVLAAERGTCREHLLLGGPLDRTGGLQSVLALVLGSTLDDRAWRLSPSSLRRLAKLARAHDERGAALADNLERIRTCEMLLAPTVSLFDFLLGSDGQTIAEAAKAVRSHWGATVPTIDVEATTVLESGLRDATGDAEPAARWIQIARSLAAGAYDDAVRLLLDHNRYVMRTRAGAAPWIDLRDGRLQVRFRDEQGLPLPERRELPECWRHPYFIDSLRTIAQAVRE